VRAKGHTAPAARGSVEERKEAFVAFVRKSGLKATRQRDRIVDVFLRSEGHLSIDELLEKVRRADPRISAATIYRTVKLLEKAGVADKRSFEGRITRYEASSDEHHDHLICTQCGRIDEFENERIETLQDQVAQSFGYEIVSHRHEIYGTCPDCRRRIGVPGGGRDKVRARRGAP
jgi:Fur family ferric uptake transcriptional regulator